MNQSFKDGLRAGVPVALSIMASFLAVGVYLHQAGISVVPSVVMTAAVFAGPAQYGVAQAIQSSTSLLAVLSVVILINVRFFVMASSLVEKFRSISLWKLAFTIPFLSASTFAVSQSGADEKELKAHDRFHYFVGVGVMGYFTAIIATFLGASVLSQHFVVPNALLTMILPFFFAAQAGSSYKNTYRTLSFLFGVNLTWLFYPALGSHSILVASAVVGLSTLIRNKWGNTCPAHG